MIRKLALPVVLAALLVAPAGAVALAPPGFVGISPQTASTREDFELMRRSGIASVRVPLYWYAVEPVSPLMAEPEWADFDNSVALAAEHGMRLLPFIWGTPPWVAPEHRIEPVHSAWAGRAWAAFLRRTVNRYGRGGVFWRENPDVPYLPIRLWEVWNEPNIITFSKRSNPARFARLMRIGGRAIHNADPGSEVILGGLFGRPLQIPPNVGSADFLDRVYRAGNVKRHFDGVALHPYVADASAMRPQIRALRRVMRKHKDDATPLYATELGWGSDSFQTRWERGPQGQARELDQAFSMLSRNRFSWRIGGVWWFSWADNDGGCQFCDSAGLLTKAREAKPAWYRFARWTGGNPEIVPRADFGD